MKRTARRVAKPKDDSKEHPVVRFQASRPDQPRAFDLQSPATIGFDRPAFSGAGAMEHASELERMANLLSLTAVIMRKLAMAQARHGDDGLSGLADTIEGVADDIADLLDTAPRHPQ